MLHITWLGESGFILADGTHKMIIDPYFTDALARRKPEMKRLLPPDPGLMAQAYDLLLFTHSHIDHTDPDTVRILLQNNPQLILAGPVSSYQVLEAALPGNEMNSLTFGEIKAGGFLRLGAFKITALPAIHSDMAAVGYLIEHQDRRYYFSGDTALLCNLQNRVPHAADAAFLCFNAGVGKNMDIADALRLAKTIAPKIVIPFHYGLLPASTDVGAFCRIFRAEGFTVIQPEYGQTFNISEVSGND